MFRKTVAVMALFLVTIGCEKPNPNPELLDPIYLDIQKQLQSSQSQLNGDLKALEDAKNELEKVTPQTGQIKYAQKKVYDFEGKVAKDRQMVQYFELRIKSRADFSRESYSRAYDKKQKWPNPEEFKLYQTQQRLDNAPKQWSVKQRMIEAGLPMGIKNPAQKAAGGEHGAEPPPSH